MISGRTTVDDVLLHVLYEVATGGLRPGDGLPSVRKAEEQWGASRLTVLKAYRRMVEMGLVKAKPRSGFVVNRGAEYDRLTRDRYVMEGLYDDLSQSIRQRRELSVLGTLRYLTRLAEREYVRTPESVFVDAGDVQAAAHAEEIRNRLYVPVPGLTLEALGEDFRGLPRSVKTVLTIPPLAKALAPLGERGVRVEAVPIEISPRTLESIGTQFKEAWLLDTDDVQITRIMDELDAAGLAIPLRPKVVRNIEAEVYRLLDERLVNPRSIILMAPTHWQQLHPALRDHSRIAPITFQIADEAWSHISDAIGMPFPSPVGL